ncbi:MAG: apolipoprotein N-acyltransferase [Thermodesulfobacteriota bacterium]
MSRLDRWRPPRGAVLAAALSGLILAVAFPPLNLWPLALVGLVPLLALARRLPPRQALVAGWLWGLALFLGLMYWLTVVFTNYGGLSWPLATLTLLILVWYIGAYAGVWACLLSWWGAKKPWVLLIAAPLAWAGLEWVRGQIFTGLPWLPYAMGLSGALPLIQSLELWSTTGLGALLVLANVLAAWLILPRLEGGRWGWSQAAAAAALVMLLALGWSWGSWRLQQVRALQAAAPKLAVTVVQGNFSLRELWNRGLRVQVLQRQMDLTSRGGQQVSGRPWLVVWPESAAPFYFLREARLSRPVLEYARQHRVYLMLGCLGAIEKGKRLQVSNRVWLLGPGGEPRVFYDKVHLVPFGEYVPLQQILFFVRAVAQIGDDFAVGQAGKTLDVSGVPVGPLICYESIFPELARAQKKNGARLLVNQTNDAWFGRTSAPYQHMAHLMFRSVENRLASARSANTGVSGFVLPSGEVTRATDIFVPAVATQSLPLMNQMTFFSRHGDIVGPAGLIVGLLLLGLSAWQRRREREAKDV